MKTQETEKPVDEIKSPTPNEETVEAAKQILADVLTKAVDAIKEESNTSLSGNFEVKDSDNCGDLEKRIDYVIRFIDEKNFKQVYVGNNYTIVQDPMNAKEFETAKEAKNFIDCLDGTTLMLHDAKVFMRKVECSLYEMTFKTSNLV